jgi:hypothetical protein
MATLAWACRVKLIHLVALYLRRTWGSSIRSASLCWQVEQGLGLCSDQMADRYGRTASSHPKDSHCGAPGFADSAGVLVVVLAPNEDLVALLAPLAALELVAVALPAGVEARYVVGVAQCVVVEVRYTVAQVLCVAEEALYVGVEVPHAVAEAPYAVEEAPYVVEEALCAVAFAAQCAVVEAPHTVSVTLLVALAALYTVLVTLHAAVVALQVVAAARPVMVAQLAAAGISLPTVETAR